MLDDLKELASNTMGISKSAAESRASLDPTKSVAMDSSELALSIEKARSEQLALKRAYQDELKTRAKLRDLLSALLQTQNLQIGAVEQKRKECDTALAEIAKVEASSATVHDEYDPFSESPAELFSSVDPLSAESELSAAQIPGPWNR
jgi:hypothetical protein